MFFGLLLLQRIVLFANEIYPQQDALPWAIATPLLALSYIPDAARRPHTPPAEAAHSLYTSRKMTPKMASATTAKAMLQNRISARMPL